MITANIFAGGNSEKYKWIRGLIGVRGTKEVIERDTILEKDALVKKEDTQEKKVVSWLRGLPKDPTDLSDILSDITYDTGAEHLASEIEEELPTRNKKGGGLNPPATVLASPSASKDLAGHAAGFADFEATPEISSALGGMLCCKYSNHLITFLFIRYIH